jgi:hypothetical protein
MKIQSAMVAGVVAVLGFNLLGSSASAETFDLASDFSIINNGAPNNNWSYGTYPSTLPPTTFTQFGTSVVVPVVTPAGPTVLDVWNNGSSDPNIAKNAGPNDFIPNPPGSFDLPAGQVAFGPYLGPTVARFTAPTTGAYTISAEFQAVQSPSINSPPAAYVYEGSTPLFTVASVPYSAAVGGTGAFATYSSGVLDLAAGTTLDFVVWGSNGNNASTEVIATVTELPEPSSIVALCGLGAVGLLLAVRRRRRGK